LTTFQIFFSVGIGRKLVIVHPTTPQMCRYTTLRNIKVLRQQLKTRLLYIHILRNLQLEATCLSSQLLSKVTITYCSIYI